MLKKHIPLEFTWSILIFDGTTQTQGDCARSGWDKNRKIIWDEDKDTRIRRWAAILQLYGIEISILGVCNFVWCFDSVSKPNERWTVEWSDDWCLNSTIGNWSSIAGEITTYLSIVFTSWILSVSRSCFLSSIWTTKPWLLELFIWDNLIILWR